MYYVVTVVVFPEAEDVFFSKKKRKYRITFRLLIWTAVRLREDTKVETKENLFLMEEVFLREGARGENSRIKLRTCSPTHVVESFFDMGKHTNKMIQIPNLVLFKKYLLLPKSFSSW